MNVKQVEVTCAGKYRIIDPGRRVSFSNRAPFDDILNCQLSLQLLDFETVFKIKLVDSADGYELEVLSDEMV